MIKALLAIERGDQLSLPRIFFIQPAPPAIISKDGSTDSAAFTGGSEKAILRERFAQRLIGGRARRHELEDARGVVDDRRFSHEDPTVARGWSRSGVGFRFVCSSVEIL